jgi:magnesium transporter
MGQARSRVYRKGVLVAEDAPVHDVSQLLVDPDTIAWVDFHGASRDELRKLAVELGLHELAVDRALGPQQRPKLDHYPTHRLLSCRVVRLDVECGRLEESEVDAFFDKRWLITVRDDDCFFDVDAVLHHWDRCTDLAENGISFLLYGLLDVIIDSYFAAVQVFDDYYDTVSEAMFEERPLDPTRQREWFLMRRSLTRFHRLVGPMREALNALMRREHATVSEDLYPYYQDVYDHILRVGESVDSLREIVGTIVETNLSLREFQQNRAVKTVTGWAAMIAVPALVTGVFGMNVHFPGAQESSGFLVALALLVASSAALYVVFRRRDWL